MMDKQWKFDRYINGILPVYLENKIMKFAGKWMEDKIILIEATQTKKDNHFMLSLACNY